MAPILLALIIVPAVELWLLLKVGAQIGALPTFAMLFATGLLGSWLIKRQGAHAMRRIRDEVAAGRMPTTELVDGMLVVIAGVLMLTPGFLTDIAGFLLLVPAVRAVVRGIIGRRFEAGIQRRMHVVRMQYGGPVDPPAVGRGQIIDVDSN